VRGVAKGKVRGDDPDAMTESATARASSSVDDLRALPEGVAVEMYRRMVTIREFDTIVPRLVQMGTIKGTAHSAAGQEAVAVGACQALRPTDYITSTHRGHGHAIAKGVDVGAMIAELFGRPSGVSGGKGGSMHIADFSVGMLGANGIVGGGFGLATGAALALQLQHSDGVVVCFFGDSAVNQGAFLENANYAALYHLPVVYLCENNQFAMSMPSARATNLERLADRALGLGFPGLTVDGMDMVATHNAVADAVAGARAGKGPTLIVADCYRFAGHQVGDTEVYRSADDIAVWQPRDPVTVFRTRLIDAGILSDAEAAAIVAAEERHIQEAINAAEAAPPAEPQDAFNDVYA
jgi:TPP-dependent pyruvate/acetoin dehydrogenase alpha subunit